MFIIIFSPTGFTRWPYNLLHPFVFPLVKSLSQNWVNSFLIFCMKFLWKTHFCRDLGKKSPEREREDVLHFLQIFSFVFLVFASQTSCLTNFLFWSYFSNFFWPIRFQDSLKCNIPKKMMDQVDFFADKRQSFLHVCSVNLGGHAESTRKAKLAIFL